MEDLTGREREVLTWTSAGKTSTEISIILCITKRTVDAHIESAMRKLNAVNRVHAVVKALMLEMILP